MENEIVRCAYCMKERPQSEMKRGEIIFQNGKYVGGKYKKFVDRATNWYCADGPCHGYDQMAHEG